MELLHKKVTRLLDTYRMRGLDYDTRQQLLLEVGQARGDINNLSANSQKIISEAEAEQELMKQVEQKLASDRAVLTQED